MGPVFESGFVVLLLTVQPKDCPVAAGATAAIANTRVVRNRFMGSLPAREAARRHGDETTDPGVAGWVAAPDRGVP
jgi:hypothetical protein